KDGSGWTLLEQLKADGEIRPVLVLSVCDEQVYAMLGHGLSSKTIGDNLGVSPKTIGTYKTRLMGKLGCRTTPELMLHAREVERTK
ncbi:MAG: helix-turn-helix transcriptional regulator, partial [Verrucomicrobiota bacterium]